jgi:hypothetical protein
LQVPILQRRICDHDARLARVQQYPPIAALHTQYIQQTLQLLRAVTYEQELQTSLSMGGFGLTSAVTLAPAAYLAGAEVTLRLSPAFAEVWSEAQPLLPSSRQYAAIDDCILRINDTERPSWAQCSPDLLTSEDVPASVVPDTAADFVRHFSTLPPTAIQHSVTYRISTLFHIARLTAAVAAGEVGTVARLRALRVSGASEWLTVLPTEPRLRLPDCHWQWAARLRLGIPVAPVAEVCAGCSKPLPKPGDGWHPLACVGGSGRHMTARHDDIVMILSRLATIMGVVNLTEPADLSATDGKRPDVEFHLPEAPLLIDVTITHPAAPSYRKAVADHGAEKLGDDRGTRKSLKYDAIATSNAMQFTPFVIFTYGGWHTSAESVLRKLVAALEPGYCLLSRRDWKDQLTQQIAVAVQRGNANIMINAAHRDQQCARHGRSRPRNPRSRTLLPRSSSAVSADSGSRSLSSPQLVSSPSRPAELATASVPAAATHTQNGSVRLSANGDAGTHTAVPVLHGDEVPTHSPILFAAPVRRCVSLPTLTAAAVVVTHPPVSRMQC